MTGWRNDGKLELIDRSRRSETDRRRFLIFLVPHPEMPSAFLASTPQERNFDLAVRFYADPGCNEGLMSEADYVMTGGLSKFHAADQTPIASATYADCRLLSAATSPSR